MLSQRRDVSANHWIRSVLAAAFESGVRAIATHVNDHFYISKSRIVLPQLAFDVVMPPPPKPRNPIDHHKIPEASTRPPDDEYYPKDRESLIYAPHPRVSTQLETAIIRYCRFARILEVRARGRRVTLPDIKTLCGDDVIWHCLRCLQLYGDDITLVQEAMECIDEALFCHSLFLNADQVKRFSQHVSTHGFALFPTLMTKLFIDAETRRRDSFVMNVTVNLRTLYYLINYQRMWNKTYEGSKINEKRFLRGVSRITDQEDKDEWEELRFKNPEKLCPVCNMKSFTSGREGLLYCSDCDDFFSLIERFRRLRKAVTTAPVATNWRDLRCFEPMPPQLAPPMVSHRPRTRSLPRRIPVDWTINKAKRFAREVCRKRRASRRLVPSVSEDDAPQPEPPLPTTSASAETIPAVDELAPDSTLAKIYAMFAPFEQSAAELQATENSLKLRYRQLNPTMADIERRVSGADAWSWEICETGKHYMYLLMKAKLLCLEVNGHESSVEISNAFAQVFNEADPDIYDWATYAIQSGNIPETAKSPWVNETSQNADKKFIMPPEYEQAAKLYVTMKRFGMNSVPEWVFSRMASL
uniref:TFIIB-type domain-containing protein n=1 Tax=Panagrellus redivivus TaxID=6233 RepID=A0A7E4ZRD3_PANRE